MSKSLKNFFWVKDVKEKGFEPLALRYLFLTAHYRSKMNFTWKSLEGAEKALNKLRQQVGGWKAGKKTIPEFEKKFLEAVNHDLDMPRAMAVVWNLAKSKHPESVKKATLLKFDQVLGLGLAEYQPLKPSREVEQLVKKREALRKKNQWKEADEVRKKVKKLGWQIEDTDKGAELKPI